MSAREIIAEIEALPPQERAVVEEYVQNAKRGDSAQTRSKAVNPAIEKSADKIFDNYDNMFRKLAK